MKRLRSSGHGIDKILRREVGDISPRSFTRLVAASESLVLRLGIHQKLEKHSGCVNTLSFNAEGDIIVSGSDDRMIMLWDWDAGLIKLEFQSGHTRNVLQARMMPYSNNKTIVTCAADGEVRHSQMLEGGQIATALLGQHEGHAHNIAVEPGSPHIFYSCGEDGVLQHFDLRTKSATKLFVCNSFKDKSDYMPIIHLYSITIDLRNPNLFAIAGSDEFARIYDIRKYKVNSSSKFSYPTNCFCPTHLIGDKQVGITGLDFSYQSELLASYNDELIYLFSNEHGLGPNPVCNIPEDLNSRSDPPVYKGHRNCDTLKGVRFFGPNCEYVASGSDCGRVFIWRKRDGKLLQVMDGDKRVVNCVEAHPYATVLASSGIENDVKIWTPNALEPAAPINMDEFPMPDPLDYLVIAPYDGEEDEDDDDSDHNSEENDCDDSNNMSGCFMDKEAQVKNLGHIAKPI